jgi:hypothetical protein
VQVHRLTSPLRSEVVAVRPDGHAGFLGGSADLDRLQRWLSVTGAAPS